MNTIELATSPKQPPKAHSTSAATCHPSLFSMSKQPVFDFAEPSPELGGGPHSNVEGLQGGFAASPVALREPPALPLGDLFDLLPAADSAVPQVAMLPSAAASSWNVGDDAHGRGQAWESQIGDLEVSAHLAEPRPAAPRQPVKAAQAAGVPARHGRNATHHEFSLDDDFTSQPARAEAAAPKNELDGGLRETTRARYAGLPEVMLCEAGAERTVAAVLLADLAGTAFRDQRFAPLSKPLLRARDGVVVLGTENQPLGLGTAEPASALRNVIVVTSIHDVLAAAGNDSDGGAHGASRGADPRGRSPTTRTLVIPRLRDYASQSGLRVLFDSEADALTYDARHHEFVRDTDWLDATQRYAVLAVGRYIAVLDVEEFIKSGSPAAFNPVLPHVTAAPGASAAAGASSANVRLLHNDDIRSVSASTFRVGLVASGGFDRRLVVTDVSAGVGGEVLQTWQAPSCISCVKWSPTEEGAIFVATDDGAIFLYNVGLARVSQSWSAGQPGLFALCINPCRGAGVHGVCVGFGTGAIGVLETASLDATCNSTLDPCVAEVGSLACFATGDGATAGGTGSPAIDTCRLACFGSGGWSLWDLSQAAAVATAPPPSPFADLFQEPPGDAEMPAPSLEQSPLALGAGGAAPFTLQLRLHGHVSRPRDATSYPPSSHPGQASITGYGVAVDTLRSAYDYGIVAKTDGCVVPAALFPRRKGSRPGSPALLVADSYGCLAIISLGALPPPTPACVRTLAPPPPKKQQRGDDEKMPAASEHIGLAAAAGLVQTRTAAGERLAAADASLSRRRTGSGGSGRNSSGGGSGAAAPTAMRQRRTAAIAAERGWQQPMDDDDDDGGVGDESPR